MKKHRVLLAVTVVSFLIVIALGALTLYNRQKDTEAVACAASFSDALSRADYDAADALCVRTGLLRLVEAPADVKARSLYDAYCQALSVRPSSGVFRQGTRAVQRFAAAVPSFDAFASQLIPVVQDDLLSRVESCRRSDEIYTKDFTFREDIVADAFREALSMRLRDALEVTVTEYAVTYEETENGWRVADLGGLDSVLTGADFQELSDTLYEDVKMSLTYVRKDYTLGVDAHKGEEPDADLFFVTYDPAEITALLSDPYAVQLIDGRDLYFHENIDFIPGEPIRAYLDETILVIVWKEARYGCAETLSEVFIADSSQLCRKIVNDSYDANRYLHATTLAAEASAVLAIGGDLYDHPGRTNGIHVYDGELKHFEQVTTDTCFITGDGGMLFAYRNQFASAEEAEHYIKEHDVRFSLCFGPVLIEDGIDVSPPSYQWGEIHDRYARGAIAKKDDGLHYLTLNMNQQGPTYWSLSLLSEETETLLSYGCTQAYALDGGQTCCTIIGGTLVNRVQFDEERDTSDIIFFATALPPAEGGGTAAEE